MEQNPKELVENVKQKPRRYGVVIGGYTRPDIARDFQGEAERLGIKVARLTGILIQAYVEERRAARQSQSEVA